MAILIQATFWSLPEALPHRIPQSPSPRSLFGPNPFTTAPGAMGVNQSLVGPCCAEQLLEGQDFQVRGTMNGGR